MDHIVDDNLETLVHEKLCVSDKGIHALNPFPLLNMQSHIQIVHPVWVNALSKLFDLGGYGQIGIHTDDV